MEILESLVGVFSKIWHRLAAGQDAKRTAKAAKEPELVIEKANEWVLKNVGKGPAKRVFISIGQFDPNYEQGKPTEFISHKSIMFNKISEKDGPIPLTLWVDINRNVIRDIGRFGVIYENADGSVKKAFVKQGDEMTLEKPENVIFMNDSESYKNRIKRLRQLRIV